jgi:hypothetical protein
MSTQRDPSLPPSPRIHRAPYAADARKIRVLWDRIFAELLPRSTAHSAAAPPSLHAEPSATLLQALASVRAATPSVPSMQAPSTLTAPVRKESCPMRAYRTESRYYFSSKQLLPVGSLVFFSEKLKRYVHPTDGILLDPHPRLQLLSETESLELETHWQTSLARY